MYIYNRKQNQTEEFFKFSDLLNYYTSASDQTELYFWSLGLSYWIPLSGLITPDMLKHKKLTPPATPAPLVDKSSSGSDDFKLVDISVPKKYAEGRKFKRYEIRLKVIISNKQKTFLSYSKNISEGGILLEDRIPPYILNEESEIYISAPDKKEIIAFRCRPITDGEDPNRLRFQDSQTAYLEKLRTWLEKS